VTTGIVSARDRDIKETAVDNFIQTDAAINPGNSGGPLFNSAGEVVGMNTALYTADNSGGSVGLGLAIPGNDVQFVLNNLREYGRVRLGFIGASGQDQTQEMALAAGFSRPTGVILSNVENGSISDWKRHRWTMPLAAGSKSPRTSTAWWLPRSWLEARAPIWDSFLATWSRASTKPRCGRSTMCGPPCRMRGTRHGNSCWC
jgi:hypothetical protein